MKVKKIFSFLLLILSFSILITSCQSVFINTNDIIKEENDRLKKETVRKIKDNMLKRDEKNKEDEELILNKYTKKEYFSMLEIARDSYEIPIDLKEDEYLGELEKLEKYIPDVKEIIDNYDLYSSEAIYNLLKYPENFLFILGTVNEKEAKKEKLITEREKASDIIYLSQTDPRWAYEKMNDSYLGFVGCGPTVMSMVSMYLLKDYSLTPDVIGQFAVERRLYLDNTGSEWALIGNWAKEHGFNSKEISTRSETTYEDELNKGGLIILNVGKGDFSYGGHYVLVVKKGDRGFTVYDPNSLINTNKIWSFEKLNEQTKNAWVVF